MSNYLNQEVVEILTEAADKRSTSVNIDFDLIRKGALVFRAVNHKLRQSIIKLLEGHDDLVVTEIYVKLRLEQSVASQHLAILRRAQIVNTKRDGKFIYYSLNKERMNQIVDISNQLAG